MIKGLAITPPVLGRISIGKIVEKNGKRLPEKDDQFTITSQIQNKDGWVKHPLDEQLRAKAQSTVSLTDRLDDRCVQAMAIPVSDLDNMALNNTLVHHLIYVHWHKAGCANHTADYMSIWMNRMN